jgi:hypothetical protein
LTFLNFLIFQILNLQVFPLLDLLRMTVLHPSLKGEGLKAADLAR